MNKESFLLFIDSGIGGISILESFLSKNDNVNIIFYADSINFPYGDRDEKEIGKILIDIYNQISLRYSISMIIIACNTASVSALKILREKVTIPVIGTVPAVKPACEQSKSSKIGIIATETTVAGKYLHELVEKFGKNKTVSIKACKNLADAAENMYEADKLNKVLIKELDELKKTGIDTLVLGCTHYSFLKQEILNFFDGKVNIIDSVKGVVKRIRELLPDDKNLIGDNKILYISDESESVIEKYKRFNQKHRVFNKIISGEKNCLKV